MSAQLPALLRVSRQRRCPVCEKPDWCLVAEDGSRAICARVASDRRAGEAGWLHVLGASVLPPLRSQRRSVAIEIGAGDFEALAAAAERFDDLDGPRDCGELARELGVSLESLRRLRVGWNGWAWTFPMVNARGATIGIRLRRPDGSKLAEKGSRQGLFIPLGGAGAEPLLITEGPTDLAAALDLGFDAIGRPSCAGGIELISSYLRLTGRRDVVVFADSDNAGRHGAQALAKSMALVARVRISAPPVQFKDLRAWVRGGARREHVDGAIDAATAVELRLEVRQ